MCLLFHIFTWLIFFCLSKFIVKLISRLWLGATVCLRLLRSKAFADCMRKPWPALLNMFCWSVQIYFLYSQSTGAALACSGFVHMLMLKRFSYFSSTFESMLTYVVFWPNPASLKTNVHCSGFSCLWSSQCAWTWCPISAPSNFK